MKSFNYVSIINVKKEILNILDYFNGSKTLLNQHYIINGNKRQDVRLYGLNKMILYPVAKAVDGVRDGNTALGIETVVSLLIEGWWRQV